MKHDILTRDDVKRLVDEFYIGVRKTPLLGKIFDDVMSVNWEKHLPKMYDFWENILFQTGNYKGFPFAAHMPVNEKAPLTSQHFDVWLQLFHETIDRLFEGENANQLKIKSSTIKEVWSSKMAFINSYNHT
jgi:hemoglobin